MFRTKPKAGLGQHFLVNKKYAEMIVEAVDPKAGENVIEIGPGKGALTDILAKRGCRIVAVELDKQLGKFLEGEYGHDDNVVIMSMDFTLLEPAIIPRQSKIIGNIPYNITTPILDKLFELREKITLVVLTVQTEVALKLTAKPGKPGYGKSTVMLWAGFDIESLFTIPRTAFSPAPEVTSRVIRLKPAGRGIKDIDNFRQFIRRCFQQKSRTLVNSMQIGFNWPKELSEYLIKKAEFDIRVRPSGITCEEYLKLYRIWQKMR
jgi:16S rRNA (adenine1518-N6/adenine1519-N6)-dimethyltransferase